MARSTGCWATSLCFTRPSSVQESWSTTLEVRGVPWPAPAWLLADPQPLHEVEDAGVGARVLRELVPVPAGQVADQLAVLLMGRPAQESSAGPASQPAKPSRTSRAPRQQIQAELPRVAAASTKPRSGSPRASAGHKIGRGKGALASPLRLQRTTSTPTSKASLWGHSIFGGSFPNGFYSI